MTHELNTDRNGQNPAEMLALGAFELGRQYQMGVDALRLEFNLKLKAMVTNVQAQMVAGETAVWDLGSLSPPLITKLSESSETAIPNYVAVEETALPAVQAYVAIESSPRNNVPSSPAWHTFRDQFMRDKPDLEKKTVWSYDQAFDIWTKLIGNKSIQDIRRGDVKAFADFLRDKEKPGGGKLSHASIQRSVGHIKTFMSWAVAAGKVEDDSFEKVSC